MNNPRIIQKIIDDRIRGWFLEIRVKSAATVTIGFSVNYYQLKYDKAVVVILLVFVSKWQLFFENMKRY